LTREYCLAAIGRCGDGIGHRGRIRGLGHLALNQAGFIRRQNEKE
jgi:hypothetical protein